MLCRVVMFYSRQQIETVIYSVFCLFNFLNVHILFNFLNVYYFQFTENALKIFTDNEQYFLIQLWNGICL
ncbi:hypothetical protein BH24ACI1_BH24ACI1_18710 [soil metagenome]